MDPTTIIILVVVALGTLAIGFFVGVFYRKKITEAKIGTAETQARVIMEDAKKEAEQRKKEALLEAKEEILRNRNEADREIKERRAEIQRQEKRAIQREENLERKLDKKRSTRNFRTSRRRKYKSPP